MNRELLMENRIHGNAMFPFGIYSMVRGSGENLFDCHWHEEFEFLLITEGCAIVQLDAVQYEIPAGQAVFIHSGMIHTGYSSDSASCSFCAVVFNPCLLSSNIFDALQDKYIDPLIKKKVNMPIQLKGEDEWGRKALEELQEIINTGVMKPIAYELIIKAHLYLIFSILLSRSLHIPAFEKLSQTPGKVEKLKKTVQYIQKNYCSKISVNCLALEANMSLGHFCRFFKQQSGKTPITYINYYRVHKAAILLEDKNKKIIDIAMEVGFDNFSYFIATFKHHMKCTPSEYRKAL